MKEGFLWPDHDRRRLECDETVLRNLEGAGHEVVVELRTKRANVEYADANGSGNDGILPCRVEWIEAIER